MQDSDLEREPVEELAEEFVARYRRGESPTIQEYSERYPEHAEQIQQLFPALLTMEKLKPKKEEISAPPTSLLSIPGQRPEELGDYRLIREIGRGGMGIVYEAEQVSLRRRVAVKVLSIQSATSDTLALRFQREAQAAARLHHTNIVPVMGVGKQDGLHYYVMQYIDGLGLDEVLIALQGQQKKKKPSEAAAASAPTLAGVTVEEVIGALQAEEEDPDLPTGDVDRTTGATEKVTPKTSRIAPRLPRKAPATVTLPGTKKSTTSYADRPYWRSVARIGEQVADALQYAHQQGILHRDIKPANLLLDTKACVWVTDFGLAKLIDEEDLTLSGSILGTLRYMAPERFQGKADARSDVYSLGLTLYELLTLQSAYDETKREKLIHQVMHEEPSSPRSINGEIPRDLETIVLKAIARDPAHRYQTAGALRDDLERYLDDKPIQARRTSPMGRLWRWCRRNPAVAGWAGVALMLLVMVAVVASVGYVRTNLALSRESEQRKKAEATLGISLEALDHVYKHFAPDRMESMLLTVASTDGEEVEVPAQPVLSPETVSLLMYLLKVYDRFSEQDSENARLREDAAKANRRIGDIYLRLGDYDEAVAAFRRSINRYQILHQETGKRELQREIARAYNDLGLAQKATLDFRAAEDSHRNAMTILEKEWQAKKSEATGFALARTYYFLGQHRWGFSRQPGFRPPSPDRDGGRGGRGGRSDPAGRDGNRGGRGGRGGSNRDDRRGGRGGRGDRGPGRWESPYLDKAITLLKELSEKNPQVADYQHLLALCYRDRSRHSTDDIKAAVTILDKLTQENPKVADYRYDLTETYVRMDFRRLREEERSGEIQRLEKAVVHAEYLVSNHPHVPAYASLKAQIQHKLGAQLWMTSHDLPREKKDEQLQDAIRHYKQSNRAISQLIRRFPDALFYQAWISRLDQSWAELLRSQGNLTQARDRLQASVKRLNGLLKKGAWEWPIRSLLSETHRDLAKIHEAMGNDTLAAASTKEAEKHRPFMFGGPRGPRPGSRGHGFGGWKHR